MYPLVPQQLVVLVYVKTVPAAGFVLIVDDAGPLLIVVEQFLRQHIFVGFFASPSRRHHQAVVRIDKYKLAAVQRGQSPAVPFSTLFFAFPEGYFPKIQGFVKKDSVKNVGRLQRFHPSLVGIQNLCQRRPQLRVAVPIGTVMGVLREPPVLVVVFIGRPIPVDANPKPGCLEAAEHTQLAVIADVARIAVLHGKSSFKPAEATLTQSLL